MSTGLNLGMGVLFSGLLLVLVVWVILRILPRLQPDVETRPDKMVYPDDSLSTDAVLILQPGGRIEHLNHAARLFFGLAENDLNADLEHIARRIRSTKDFLSLCASPGQARLVVDGKLVQGASYLVPGIYPLMLISLRELNLTEPTTQGSETSEAMLRMITDLGQAFATSLDVGSTVQTILENVRQLVPSDYLELKIWDEEEQRFDAYALKEGIGSLPARRGTKTPPGSQSSTYQDREDKESTARASLPRSGEVSSRLIYIESSRFGDLANQTKARETPLLLTREQLAELPGGNGSRPQLQSYLGIPLKADGQLIGLIEAGHVRGSSFNPSNLEAIRLVAAQAALALRNARKYDSESRRGLELTGISEINQSLGSFSNLQELFTRLVETLTPLFDTEILGFILFNEDKRILEGQVPFAGLPPHFVEIYRASIPAGSPAEKIILERKPILTRHATQDENWRILGLTDVAVAASLRDSALMPLVSGERTLGYLQVSHHAGGPLDFTNSELRLMNQIANQVATILDHFNQLHQADRHGRRAEAMSRISALAASPANLEDVLGASVNELALLFQADAGAIFLLDESHGILRSVAGTSYGISEQVTQFFPEVYVDDPGYRSTVTSSLQPLLNNSVSVERHELPLYNSIISTLKLESMMIVPLVVHGHGMGELMLASTRTDHFETDDLRFLTNAAAQLALVFDANTQRARSDPELLKHVNQLIAISRISRELSGSLELRHLLEVIHSEGMQITQADCAAVLLFEASIPPTEINPIGSIGCIEGRELSSFERDSLIRKEPLIISDFEGENLKPPHSGVRSALYVPILHNTQNLGAIHLHSNHVNHFTSELTDLVQTLAAQASTALMNSRRFEDERINSEQHRRQAETLGKLTQVGAHLDQDQPLEHSLQDIASGIRNATPFRVVLVSLLEPDTGMMRRITAVGIPDETLKDLLARKQPLASLQHLMQPQFKISRSYFVPADQTPILPADVHYVYSTYEDQSAIPAINAWDPDDFLLFPLEDSQGQIIGLISADDPADGLRPDRATIESIEAFAVQAALLILNQRQVSGLREQVESLSAGIQRQQKLLNVTQNDLPVLLRKDLEQTISLHNLDQRAQRVRAGLAITESVSRQLDASSALLALGRETLTQLGMTAALVAENTPDGPRLLHILGSVSRSANVEALFGQRNPIRACLQSGEPILVSNLDEDDEWRDATLLTSLRVKGFICLPIKVEEKPVAAMMAVSPEAMPPFTLEDHQVYFQISKQSSVILQNIALLNETRRRLQEVNLLLDFSRMLSGLDRAEILEALLASAHRVLPSAHAGAVFVRDLSTGMLFPQTVSGYADNESMMRIKYRPGEALPGSVFIEKRTRRIDEVNFARDYALSAENLAFYRQAAGGRLPVSCLLVPILTGEQTLGLLILDNFNTVAAFRPEDETLMTSLSQQVALSLENVRLVQATQERAGQLQALNEVATSMTSSLRKEQLIATLLDQLTSVLPFDTATLYLRDQDRLKIVATRGFPEDEGLLGLSVAVSDSNLFNQMANTGQSISVGDVREDARFPRLEVPRLSWLGIPLISKGELSGVLALEKWQAQFYSREQVQVGFTFASQAAVALENARLYEDSLNRASDLDERSQRLALLNRFSSSLSGLLNSDQILQLAAEELLQALGARRVSGVVFDRGQAVWKFSSPGVRINLPRFLRDAPIFDRLRESLGVFNTEDIRKETILAPLTEMLGETSSALMVLPVANGQNLTALMFVQSTSNEHYNPVEIELAKTITSQAAIAMESARLYQSSVQTANQLAILNETSSQFSAHLDPEAIYQAVHRAADRLMPAESFVISMLDEIKNEIEGVYLVDGETRTPVMRLPRDQGLTGRILETGQPILLHNATDVSSTGGVKFGRPDSPLSVLAVPMVLGGKVRGMLSVQSYQPNVYTDEDQQILGTLANQAIVAIQNARLFAEIQRLAEELEERVVERTAQLQREQQNTETLLRILTEVSSSLDLDRALNRTLSLLNEATGAEQGTILLLHADDNLLHYRAGYGYLTERAERESRAFTMKIGEGLAGWTVQTREAALVGDVVNDPHWVQSSSTHDHRSAIVVPMIVGEDVIGVLMIFHRAVDFFNNEMLNLVKAIASQVAVSINNAHLYELIRDQAERLGVMLRKEQEDASRSQAILEAVADGVLVTSADNKITFVNVSTERILQIKQASLIGTSLASLPGLFGKAAGEWLQTIQRWAEDPSDYHSGDTYAEQLELENGRIALVHLAPVILQNDFLGTVSIFRDITQEVEVDRLKSEFVATVSHELRTPMTSIKGYIDLLQMGAAGAMNENQEHFIEIVSNNINRLNVLLDELLDVSRLQSGRVILSQDAVDLRALVEEFISNARTRSEKESKPLTISLEAQANLPTVLGDAQKIRTILGHLIDNAYNYTPANGTIQIGINPMDEQALQVDIKDSGIGILQVNQDRVFERFWRGEDPLVLRTPGTGLGLSIVRELIEMHNGRIWLTSSGIPGEGSTFSFTLPTSGSTDQKAEIRTAQLRVVTKGLPIPPKDPPAHSNDQSTNKQT